VEEGDQVSVTSRRGSVRATLHIDPSLRRGLAFLAFHYDLPVNFLTIDATDPKSGTAEFKASAVRIEKVGAAAHAGN
jgi:formate dehydrogenase major subunit